MATITGSGRHDPIARPSERWLERIDRWCEQFGDSLNPILVKETRQALKSRQFVMTFSVLLFAALAWTIVGSLSMMPQIYTSPSAPRMLIGYYIVLASADVDWSCRWLRIDRSRVRSMTGRWSCLSITALSPMADRARKTGQCDAANVALLRRACSLVWHTPTHCAASTCRRPC